MRAAEMAELGDAPYLQSRFYRAPENILGYDPRVCACALFCVDVWVFGWLTCWLVGSLVWGKRFGRWLCVGG